MARSRERQSKEADANEPRNEITEELVVLIFMTDNGQSDCNDTEPICNTPRMRRQLSVIVNHVRV